MMMFKKLKRNQNLNQLGQVAQSEFGTIVHKKHLPVTKNFLDVSKELTLRVEVKNVGHIRQ